MRNAHYVEGSKASEEGGDARSDSVYIANTRRGSRERILHNRGATMPMILDGR